MRVRPRTAVTVALGLSGLLAVVAGQVAANTGPSTDQAEALAAAGVVQQSDLPKGYFAPPMAANAADEEAQESAYYECLGTAAPAPVARNSGSVFVHADKAGSPGGSSSQVDSKARVLPDSDAAAAAQQLLGSEKGADCFKEQLLASINRMPDVTKPEATSTLVPISVKDADEAWAYKFDFSYLTKDKPVGGNGFVVGSRVGETLLDVTYAGSGREFTAEEAAGIARAAVERVKQVVGNSKSKVDGHDTEPGGKPAKNEKSAPSADRDDKAIEIDPQTAPIEKSKSADEPKQDSGIAPELPSLRPGATDDAAAPAEKAGPTAPQEQANVPGVDPVPPTEGGQPAPAAPDQAAVPVAPGVDPVPPAAEGSQFAPAAPDAPAPPDAPAVPGAPGVDPVPPAAEGSQPGQPGQPGQPAPAAPDQAAVPSNPGINPGAPAPGSQPPNGIPTGPDSGFPGSGVGPGIPSGN